MQHKETSLPLTQDSLREKAEKMQRLVTLEEASRMNPEQVQSLIQELQIYQTELEMQNQQLQLAAAELQLAQHKYQELYDTAPFGYLSLDQNGLITEANLSAAHLLGLQRLDLYRRRFSQFVHPDNLGEFYTLFSQLQSTLGSHRAELQLLPLQGEPLFVLIEASRLPEEQDFSCRLAFLDVTDRRKADEALKKNEELLSSIINSSINGIQVLRAIRNAQGQIEDFQWVLLNSTAEEFMDTTQEHLQQTTLLQELPQELPSGRFQKYVDVVETGQPHRFSVQYPRKGKVHWLNCVLVKMADGFVLTYDDVTKQHEADEQLQASLHLLQKVADTLPDFLYVEDLELSRNVYNNRDFLSFLGYTTQDFNSHPRDFLDTLIHPRDVGQILARPQRFAHTPDRMVLETQVRVKDKAGHWRTILFRDSVFKRDANGKPLQLLGIAQDITEKLRSEQQLQMMHKNITGILENIPIIIWRIDAQGRITESMGSGLRNMGYQDHELEGKLIADPHPAILPNIKTVLGGETDIFIGELEVDGKKIYKHNYFLHDKETGGGIGFCLDITEQKLAEAEINWRNFILEQLIQKLPLVLGVLDKNGTFLELRGKGLSRLGLTDNQLAGRNLFEFFPQLNDTLEHIRKGEAVNFIERKEHNGHYAYYQNFGIFDPEREHGIAFAIDITDLKEAQDTLMTEKKFSDNLLENSIDGIMAFDRQLHITAWNKAMEKITSRKREALLSQPLLHLFPAQGHTVVQSYLDRVLAGERLTLDKIPYLNSDRSFEVNLIPLFNPEEEVTGALCIVHDNTLLKQRQQAETRDKLARQKEIMNAVLSTQEEERRRIAEALHNSLAQLLYAAKLNLEDLSTGNLQEQDPKETARRVSGFLEEAIKETRTLAHELVPTSLKDFGLKKTLKALAGRLSKESFQVQCVVTGFDTCKDETLETAIFRMVQELLNNVMKHAGATEALVQVIDKGPVIMIRVEDNGKGMPLAAELNQPSKGMGLTTIQNRVMYMQGKMQIESSPQNGTVITIEMPH